MEVSRRNAHPGEIIQQLSTRVPFGSLYPVLIFGKMSEKSELDTAPEKVLDLSFLSRAR